MKCGLLPLLAACCATACLNTRVEVVTEIDFTGAGVRSVIVTSSDEGGPAQHPGSLQAPGFPYSVLESDKGRLHARGYFADVNGAAPAFQFRSQEVRAASFPQVTLTRRDWGLFTWFSYREIVHDVVDPEGIKAALDELVAVGMELSEAALRGLLGPDFEQTRLRQRLRGDLRELARELAFLSWRELVNAQGGARDPLAAWAQRACNAARRYGLDLQPEWFQEWQEEGPAGAGLANLRRAIAGWAEQQLQPLQKEQGGRSPLWPPLEPLLFDGPFVEALLEQARKRFGGPEQLEQWFQGAWTGIFGMYGPLASVSLGADSLEFVFRVRMPGQLIRSNGFLSDDGWTFVQFPKDRIYPGGAGMECESVVWNHAALGLMPGTGVYPTNENALRWTWLLGKGPDSQPEAALLALVEECVARRSLEPLRAAIGSAQEQGQPSERPAALLAWLEGRRD